MTSEWPAFRDCRYPIYVDARHKGVPLSLIAQRIATLVRHGDGDHIVPVGASATLSSKLIKNIR